MKENNHIPDVALIGEPTNPDTLGQEVKIGRRGSLSGVLTIKGKQGHVAYQHLADNPMPKLVQILDSLASYSFDEGSEFFPKTNLEITTIDVGNTADNVIPQSGQAKFNIRFNDKWNSATLDNKIREIIDSCGYEYELNTVCGAESFLTQPGEWSDIVRCAVQEVTGRLPELTTNGGTSDARFVSQYCPVAEFGGINATIHQINENAAVKDLKDLAQIFKHMLQKYCR